MSDIQDVFSLLQNDPKGLTMRGLRTAAFETEKRRSKCSETRVCLTQSGSCTEARKEEKKDKEKNVTLSLQILDQFLASTIRTMHAEPSRAWFQFHSSLFSTTSFYTRLSITWTPGLAWFIFPWSVWRFCWHSVDRDQKYVYIHQYTGQFPYNKLHSPKCQ